MAICGRATGERCPNWKTGKAASHERAGRIVLNQAQAHFPQHIQNLLDRLAPHPDAVPRGHHRRIDTEHLQVRARWAGRVASVLGGHRGKRLRSSDGRSRGPSRSPTSRPGHPPPRRTAAACPAGPPGRSPVAGRASGGASQGSYRRGASPVPQAGQVWWERVRVIGSPPLVTTVRSWFQRAWRGRPQVGRAGAASVSVTTSPRSWPRR